METTIKPTKTPSVSKVAVRPRRKTTTVVATPHRVHRPAQPREPYVVPGDRSTILAFYFYMGMLGIALIYFLLLPFFM